MVIMATDKENQNPLQQDVAEMQKTIKKQNEEISTLRDLLASISNGEGDLRDAKLIEIFKKNRILNVQLERERTRIRTMRKTVVFIQEELRRREQGEVREDKFVKLGIHYWVEKYQRTSTKLMEAQSKIGSMDAKLQKLVFAIRREVGEHIPIDKVLEEGSGWVGRSEQISLLKGKVDELKGLVQEMMPKAKPVGYTTLHHDERRTIEILHRNQIEKVDHDRRIQYDNLAHDFVRLTKAWGEQRDKLLAANARRLVLEKEIHKAKSTVAILLSKSKNDDLLINALSIELGGARQALGPPFSKPGGPTHMEYATNHNKLAARYHELYTQCHEQDSWEARERNSRKLSVAQSSESELIDREREIKVQGEILQTFQAALDPPDNVTDWVTASLVQSSCNPEPRMILQDDFFDQKTDSTNG